MVAHHRGVPARPPAHPRTPERLISSSVREFLKSRTGRPTAVDLFCGAGGLSAGLRAGRIRRARRRRLRRVGGPDPRGEPVRASAGAATSPTRPSSSPPSRSGASTRRSRRRRRAVPALQPRRRVAHHGSRGDRASARAHDHRADLWSSFIAVVERLRPAAVLVENVPDLPRWDDGAVLIGLYESLRALGYRVEARILDGFRHGVPQHRQRLILIGFDGRRQPDLAGAGRTSSSRSETRSATCRRSRARSAPSVCRTTRAGRPRDFQRADAPGRARRVRGTSSSSTSAETCAPTTWRRSGCSTEGQTYIDLPERLRRYRSDVFTDKYKRLQLGRAVPIDHRAHRQGRLLVHPPGSAPDALDPRGGARPELPRRVPVRRHPDAPVPPDRQRRAGPPRRGGRAERCSGRWRRRDASRAGRERRERSASC